MKNILLHGDATRPAHVGGLLPRGKISVIALEASPTVNGAALAEIAAGVAAAPVSTGLAEFKSGEARRSFAGLLRGPLSAAEPVVFVTSGSATGTMDSVTAAVLYRGVRHIVPVACVRAHPDPTRDEGVFNTIRDAHSRLDARGGAIIVTSDFSRELLPRLLAMCSSFPDSAIVIATTTPVDIPEEFIGARIAVADDGLTFEPAAGASVAPFACKWARDAILLGSDEISVVSAGPRRAWAPPVREKPEQALPSMKPKPRDEVTCVYLLPIPSTRELAPDERDLFGDAPWTSDRLTALKLAAGVPGPAVIAVCHAPDRDPDGRNASADVSWLTSEIRHQGLAEKIIAERAPFGLPWHAPAERKVA